MYNISMWIQINDYLLYLFIIVIQYVYVLVVSWEFCRLQRRVYVRKGPYWFRMRSSRIIIRLIPW